MELLDIKIPALTRIQYANKKSEQIWSKKIEIGNRFYPQIEFNTVKHDIRKCMLLHAVQPDHLDVITRNLSKQGLVFVPLQKERASGSGAFNHVATAYEGEGQFTYRAVVAKSIQDAEQFIHAEYARDDIKIGQLLGFPECCSRFFDRVWKQGYYDPIWQQAEGTTSSSTVKNRKDFQSGDGHIEKRLIRMRGSEDNATILAVFRYIGIRVLSHFACSFDCKHSTEVANRWLDLGRDTRLRGLEQTLEVLNLPFEWDCYKGIAVINTPVFRIVTDSMPCYPNHIIQRESHIYPDEAPRGLFFPWKPL